MRLKSLVAAAGLACVANHAFAEQSEITLVRYRGVPCLPLTVMEDHKLVEKHARSWSWRHIRKYPALTTGALTLDAVVSGRAQFSATGVAPFLLLGTIREPIWELGR
jgi:NitT/TauT family transport system substrate-binding protein